MKFKLALGAAFIAIALYAYVESQSSSRSPNTGGDNRTGQLEHVSANSDGDHLALNQGATTVAQETPSDKPMAEVVKPPAPRPSTAERFELSVEAKQTIEAIVYDFVSGLEMPTYGYVDAFSCELHACSIEIRVIDPSRLLSNAAKIMNSLNASLLSVNETGDVQIGLESVNRDQSGEGVLRFVTMERRPSKYKISVDETTGAITTTLNEEAIDDSNSQ